MYNERRYTREQPGSQQSMISGKKMINTLIIINIAMFILFSNNPEMTRALSVSVDGIKSLRLYTLITAMFMHGDFMHIFFNMWSLYIFGGVVAPYMGGGRFLALYLIGGVTGNLLWLAANWSTPGILLGASGATFGVMLAVAMLLPQARFMLIFFPAPIRITTMVIVFAVLEIINEMQQAGNIAHLAHLGGFVGAYIYLRFAMAKAIAWDPLRRFSGMPGKRKARPEKMADGPKLYRNPEQPRSADNNAPVTRGELDHLLEKISRNGINSLSEEEMARLRKAREQMRGETTQD